MKAWIVLPYDGSPVARASLKRAADAVAKNTVTGSYAGVVLATAGVDPVELDGMIHQAQEIAGPDVPLELHLLNPGDPVGALHSLADSMPSAVLAAPMQGTGRAAWYADACKIGGEPHTLMLFMISPGEVERFEEDAFMEHHGQGGPLRALRHLGARLHVGPRAPTVQTASSRR